MSIGIMSHGEVVLDHHLGFANLEQRKAANSSTRYALGSLTKAFISSAVARLCQDGRLKWDEPLTTYIPELSFSSDPTLAAHLTLTDLLSHHTGLVRLDALWLGADGEVNMPKNCTVLLCSHLYPIHSLRSQ